ncbi:ATP-dependent nuclease [Sphingomonas aerolata]|uniref:ATP-dependent nuclease n=1 Tax=Sphingomonas aerolata TaxID=185951 RepID=UPI00335AE4E4
MHLKKLAVRNFRRLNNVVIDLASDISIFVGANNSGKTSVGHALQLFTGRGKFSVHDFSANEWPQIVAFGEGDAGALLPSIEIDVWLEIGADDIHRVVDLLPSLAWEGSLVGMRVVFAPINPEVTQARFTEARQRARDAMAREDGEALAFEPAPRNLREYLRDKLSDEYELRHFVLDPRRFNQAMVAEDDYQPKQLTGLNRTGSKILESLLRIDFLHAQRHLSDLPGSARAENLSRVLSRFYGRNLEQRGEDLATLRALAESEVLLNEHLERVFAPTLHSLAQLGYPGLANPRLMIRSALDPESIMSSRDGAQVHYAIGPDDGGAEPPMLPDNYNGLGFKNLIFMVVELLDIHAQWLGIEDTRPPVHLIFIEEPEAHLHAQLQQAFIRKVMHILALSDEDRVQYTSQVVVTTHSTHILYERGFRPIRYFRRSRSDAASTSDVLNLSHFYDDTDPHIRTFLERYLRLTHCDLFFADATILVEGNVERLLLPQMIENAAPRLQSTYLTVLEIGGAFGYRFKALIEFLGLTALVITDLDSVVGAPVPKNDAIEPPALAEADAPIEDDDDEDEDVSEEPLANGVAEKPGKACIAGYPDAATSNQTLQQWLPRCGTVATLWAATDDDCTQLRVNDNEALVRVVFQRPIEVTWGVNTLALAGRTLEEAFALENLVWCQDMARKPLQLRIPKSGDKDLTELVRRIHRRVQAKSFKKTDFALALLAENPTQWTVPAYIAKGLRWLENELAPLPANGIDQGEAGDEALGDSTNPEVAA